MQGIHPATGSTEGMHVLEKPEPVCVDVTGQQVASGRKSWKRHFQQREQQIHKGTDV